MLVGDIRNQIDGIWNDFWSGGVSNPLSVMEQLTYLLFIRRLDELQTLEELKAQATGQPLARRIFPEGADEDGEPYENLRWSKFKDLDARELQAYHPINLLSPVPRGDDHRHVRLGPDQAKKVQAIVLPQLQIENDDVWLGAQAIDHLDPVGGGRGLEAIGREVLAQHRLHRPIIVDDQDAGRGCDHARGWKGRRHGDPCWRC